MEAWKFVAWFSPLEKVYIVGVDVYQVDVEWELDLIVIVWSWRSVFEGLADNETEGANVFRSVLFDDYEFKIFELEFIPT